MDGRSDAIPPWLWYAVRELYAESARIDGEDWDAAQRAQDPEAGQHEWCRLTVELLNEHRVAHEKSERFRRGVGG